ncbi:MAG: hypothetical protein IJ668_06110 [Selenomonadaceae bacterium]|nr:hypothetical protein [Selenomonadaceae bacterium]
MKPMRFLLALVLMLSLMLTAEAKTPEEVAAERNGYDALKAFLEAPKSKADCTSTTQLIFHCPYAHAEFKVRGLERPKQKSEFDIGSLDLDIAAGGELINFDLPFYIVQDGTNLNVYFYWEDKWKKLSFNDVPLDELDNHDAASKLALVDHAVLLSDSMGQQVIQVFFDGAKVANLLSNAVDKNQNQMKGDEAKKADAFGKCLSDALIKTGTIEMTFNIDKATRQALMIDFNMSPVLGNVLREVAMQDDVMKMGLSDILNDMASMTQLQLYEVNDYSGEYDAKEFVLPKKVRKAEDVTKDMMAMAKTESTKTQ